MSEELRRGIPKGITVGRREFTKEECEKADRDFEKILREVGVMKEGETIEDWKNKSEEKEAGNSDA